MKKRNLMHSLVMRFQEPVEADKVMLSQVSLHALLERLRTGKIDAESLEHLHDMGRIFEVAANMRDDLDVQVSCRQISTVCEEVKERFDKTGKFGLTGLNYQDLVASVNELDHFLPTVGKSELKLAVDTARQLFPTMKARPRK